MDIYDKKQITAANTIIREYLAERDFFKLKDLADKIGIENHENGYEIKFIISALKKFGWTASRKKINGRKERVWIKSETKKAKIIIRKRRVKIMERKRKRKWELILKIRKNTQK